ncbi:hypothetical protein B0H16DRAFT_1517057 [Mycena metata]|uniref:DUF7330 domain-containing protein n=1 Tax=Mycena metata TaxID=1033252 RepID=A0AAD7JQY6_9AGAR|nr:hypothetical protein B0H16DRAFT_1517057 [Mycena metata]
MIITVDSDVKDIQQLDIIVNRATVADDPPPAYTNDSTTDNDAKSPPPPPPPGTAEPSPPPSPPPQLASVTVPPSVKPTNFLSLSRGNQPIKGTYVIDPRIKIPQFLLPALAADETESTRRNAFLHTSNGSIDVSLFVVGDGDYKQKANILVKSSNGSVVAKLHTTDTATRPPVKLCAKSSNGTVTIHLPRTFCGPVTLRTNNGAVRFSDAVAAELTTFSEAQRTRRCFVGDFSGSGWTGEAAGWRGDEVEVETSNGGIRLQYVDGAHGGETGEGGGAEGKGKNKGTFLGRLFGGL